ncbi:MAG: protein kinase [Thermoanaerobaculia bacterium]|jgi:formylglycine-generating enzyme required for sulfatase activity/dienelactone hydrolase
MADSRIESGSALLHYRLIERLGAGGMGVVWRALDTILDREVAIKILPEEFARDPERLARFEREAKLLASLNHPNVAAVYGLHQDGAVRFLAMELVRGRTLGEELAHGIEPPRVVELAAAIAGGLAAAHRQHVIHRDLKPDNIMIDRDGRPKILDFGLAKLGGAVVTADDATALRDGESGPRKATTTRQGTLLGTVAYMSPEQAQGQAVDQRSDIFSFGIVLYEMATGRRPFSGDNTISLLTSILRDTPPPVTALVPAAPEPLDSIVFRCLEKKPDARYADASALRDALDALRVDISSGSGRNAMPLPRKRAGRVLTGAALLVVLALAGTWFYRRQAQQRWLRNEALPALQSTVDRIQALEEGRESWDAWVLARKIEAVAPGEPLVAQLRGKFTRPVSIESDPPGATVTVRYYDDPDSAPIVLGKTPIEKFAYPRGFTRVHLELAGKQPVDDVIWNFPLGGDGTWSYPLGDSSTMAPEMVRVPAGAFDLYLSGFEHLPAVPTVAFDIDRNEVTNREFKRFVDAGGYAERKYWTQPFVDGDRTLSFEEAIARFTDRTGRTGPATWEVGAYPAGQDDYPVAGVSWYEAAAYAAWAGKRLPTVYHWTRVAFTVASSRIVPFANLSGSGAVPVGSTKSVNRFGARDLAGNVREWVSNANDDGRSRFILGAGWNDPDYAFSDSYAQPAFDRSATNGFRCIRIVGGEPKLAELEKQIDRRFRDFYAQKPVSDEVFAQYLRLFAYDKAPLDAKIDEEKRTSTYVRQKITFRAAYGEERMMAYLFLPLSGKAPYQVVLTFPGSGSIGAQSSATLEPGRIDFVVRSGRAIVWPIYKGTYERADELSSDTQRETTFYKDHVIMWAKDMSRTIDYLETRSDVDASKLAYYGLSWGGAMGAIMPAVEPRIKANVLYVAGLSFQKALPEADQVNYVGKVKQPTLILNGELDFFFPPETSQKPLFDLLGSPADQKKRLVFPGGHSVPRTDMIKESLDWLDRYLGPV